MSMRIILKSVPFSHSYSGKRKHRAELHTFVCTYNLLKSPKKDTPFLSQTHTLSGDVHFFSPSKPCLGRVMERTCTKQNAFQCMSACVRACTAQTRRSLPNVFYAAFTEVKQSSRRKEASKHRHKEIR